MSTKSDDDRLGHKLVRSRAHSPRSARSQREGKLCVGTGSNAPKGVPIRLPYAHSRLCGFGFCTGVGRPGRHYDETTYLNALRKRGSPLLEKLDLG